jgi:MobA/VirD2-like, nuclease domain
MIAKGVPHAHGARLARYLITGKDRERAELLELRGFAVENIVDAFRSVHVMAYGSKCVFPFFHVSVRNPDGETLDHDQWTYTANAIEQSLGLGNQPRAIAFHTCEETGESHMHVAWSRIDQENLTAKPLPYYKERLRRTSRVLERHFGLTELSNSRKGPIAYAPTRREEEQSRRLGIDLRDHRETIRDCFERSDCGRSFQRALADQGLTLALGDRRDFLAIDRAGGMHALGKRILGVHAAEIRARFSDLSFDQLPSVEEARQFLRSSVQAPDVLVLETPTPQPLTRPAEEEPVQAANGGADVPAASSEEAMSDLALPPVVDVEAGRIPTSADAPTSATEATQSKEHSRGFAATLKRQFRAAVQALLKRTPSPQPQPRRRRSGETVGSFRLAARSLLRPIIRVPAVSRAVGFLNEALPWLHLWEWNETADPNFSDETSVRDDNHLSPHP